MNNSRNSEAEAGFNIVKNIVGSDIVGSLNIPTIIVSYTGKIINYNDASFTYFDQKLSVTNSIEEFIPKNVWKNIRLCKETVGSLTNKETSAVYYFRDIGEHYILIIETSRSKETIKKPELNKEAKYIAYLAHHINNPLTVIKNTHELIKFSMERLSPHLENLIDKCGDNDDEKDVSLKKIVSMLMGNITDQGESLKQLEQNMKYLRNLGMIPIGHKVKNLSEIELYDLISNINNKLDFLLKNVDYKTNISRGAGSILMRVDPDDFLNLFYIIFNNSLYSIVRTDSDTKQINIKIKQDEDYIAIEIENSGKKMNEKELAHCFDPFFSTKSNAEGLGLGLTNANAIVRSYDGKISIMNKLNSQNGVVYKLFFPKRKVII